MDNLTRRNFIGIMGATAGAGVLGALATAEAANAAETKKTLIIGAPVQQRSATPWVANDTGTYGVLSLVGEYLAFQTVDGSLEPRIAENWKPSSKGQSWTFYLRKGVKFHDGTEVTADDVVYSFKSHLNPVNISNFKGVYKDILVESGIVKVDKYTVRFDLLSPNANFPYSLASTTAGAVIIKNGSDGGPAWANKMMSAGPWIMVNHKQNERSLFKKNLNYWAGNNSSFDFIKLEAFANSSVTGATGNGSVTLSSTSSTYFAGILIALKAKNVTSTQTFTASGSWTAPCGVTSATVECWGGGGGGWLTGEDGRFLPREQHEEQYCSEKGGMLIVSSYEACKGWNGEFEGQPNQGGDCTHLDLSNMNSFNLKSHTLYWGNSTFIHESLALEEDVERQLVRITLPADAEELV